MSWMNDLRQLLGLPLTLAMRTQEGTADFYGIIVVKGNPFIRGTSSIYGSFISSGTITNKGNGTLPEINYNGNIIKQINRAYTISVNIVPNTWEEYAVPVGTPTSVVSNP